MPNPLPLPQHPWMLALAPAYCVSAIICLDIRMPFWSVVYKTGSYREALSHVFFLLRGFCCISEYTTVPSTAYLRGRPPSPSTQEQCLPLSGHHCVCHLQQESIICNSQSCLTTRQCYLNISITLFYFPVTVKIHMHINSPFFFFLVTTVSLPV